MSFEEEQVRRRATATNIKPMNYNDSLRENFDTDVVVHTYGQTDGLTDGRTELLILEPTFDTLYSRVFTLVFVNVLGENL